MLAASIFRRGLRVCLVALAAFAPMLVAAQARICIDRDTMVFGDRSLGTSTSAVANVVNCGSEAFRFTDVSVHSATGPAFTVQTTCSTGQALAVGEACAVSVGFAPATPARPRN